ncbi:unnamed protein product [Bursaphelenchus okinawaensis]|uniref:GDNF/GAS1 domain-containing protein n=1 Tax=Bursaphelenchus okinawaensis TaxID=465554 RepID=A0A811K4V9_9BILA|nr:unnamed protein product [Bursaphelenchus okinawaensis]CAG9091382.1 unnamed protein product [Bursaphelenchus okinawaensis]
MTRWMRWALCAVIVLKIQAQPPQQSEECLKASKQCEENTDCIHRLAVLQSACVTNTCQPQCRESAMNLYQNREGRQLLRTDASCVPGRYELEKCGLLPLKSPKHCSMAKLVCETDLQCNAKWEVFVSECEGETNQGRCSEQCRQHLNATLSTTNGADLRECTCTDKEDQRCLQLKDITLKTCFEEERPTPPPFVETNRVSDVDPISHADPRRPASSDPRDMPDTAGQTVLSLVVLFSMLGLIQL